MAAIPIPTLKNVYATSTEDPTFKMRIVRGKEAAVEDILRRLQGDCWYAPGFGVDLRSYLNRFVVAGQETALVPIITGYVMKSPWVLEAYTTVSFVDEVLNINIIVLFVGETERNTIQLRLTPDALTF